MFDNVDLPGPTGAADEFTGAATDAVQGVAETAGQVVTDGAAEVAEAAGGTTAVNEGLEGFDGIF